jgi:hypothetical protein
LALISGFQLGSLSLFPSLEVAEVFVAGGGIGLSGERILDALGKLNILSPMAAAVSYTEDDIKSLDWREHIRLRPGNVYREAGRWIFG